MHRIKPAQDYQSSMFNVQAETEVLVGSWYYVSLNQCFRFAKWIKEQELPKELKGYCKNVLNYLGRYDEGFDGGSQKWDDECQQN